MKEGCIFENVPVTHYLGGSGAVTAAKFEKDVLIVHGSTDFIVNKKYSEQAASLYKNCELHIVEGANHGFNTENYAFNNDYDEITWNYVKTYLNNHS